MGLNCGELWRTVWRIGARNWGRMPGCWSPWRARSPSGPRMRATCRSRSSWAFSSWKKCSDFCHSDFDRKKALISVPLCRAISCCSRCLRLSWTVLISWIRFSSSACLASFTCNCVTIDFSRFLTHDHWDWKITQKAKTRLIFPLSILYFTVHLATFEPKFVLSLFEFLKNGFYSGEKF